MVEADPFSSTLNLRNLREQLSGGSGLSPLQAYVNAQVGGFGELSGAPVANPGHLGPGGGWMKAANLSPAERWVIMRESGGKPDAQNPTSTAFGIWQGLASTRKAYLGADWQTTNPLKQLDAMRRYIGDRYGTAEKAVEFHKRKGFY